MDDQIAILTVTAGLSVLLALKVIHKRTKNKFDDRLFESLKKTLKPKVPAIVWNVLFPNDKK